MAINLTGQPLSPLRLQPYYENRLVREGPAFFGPKKLRTQISLSKGNLVAKWAAVSSSKVTWGPQQSPLAEPRLRGGGLVLSSEKN